jgi:Abnormal spindle-like microcephaly-assoc'd, ASPM-SPD-2-Hydin
MDIPDRHSGSGDMRFTGASTGQVQVGRFILDVPSPGGTTLSLAPRRARTDPPAALTAALAQDPPTAPAAPAPPAPPPPPDAPAERDFTDKANQLLDTAEAVTDKVEHVTDTVQAILEGRIPDAELISGDLVEWLGLMQRLAQSGRFAEVIKLGQPLCRLLALTLRWAALVETLRLVFHAATALADTPTTAWTQHELGTLHGSVGDRDRARELLNQARQTREEIGDEEGLRATDHNLKVLSGRLAISRSTAALVGVGVVVLIIAVLVFAETVGGGSSPRSATSSTTASTTRSSTTASTRKSSTTSHSTSVHVTTSGTPATAPNAFPRPRAIPFPATTIGQSAPMEVNLVNNGPGPLTVTSAQISDTSEFMIASNTCTGQVAADTFCTVTVDFTPTAAGPASAVLTFTDDADPTTQQVPLTGTGQPQTSSGTGTTTPTTPSTGTATQPVLQ